MDTTILITLFCLLISILSFGFATYVLGISRTQTKIIADIIGMKSERKQSQKKNNG